MIDISEISAGIDIPFYPEEEKKMSETDQKAKVFVLALLALIACGRALYRKKPPSAPPAEPVVLQPEIVIPAPIDPLPPEEENFSPQVEDIASHPQIDSSAHLQERDCIIEPPVPIKQPDDLIVAPTPPPIPHTPQSQTIPDCTPKERATIEYIFSNVATRTITLLALASDLEAAGKKITHLHPFALFKTVNPKYVQAILLSKISQKRTDMMNGIAASMLQHRNGLLNYTADLAVKMGKDQQRIDKYIDHAWSAKTQDWTDLVKYLFNVN